LLLAAVDTGNGCPICRVAFCCLPQSLHAFCQGNLSGHRRG
jgi:hypothetical protein